MKKTLPFLITLLISLSCKDENPASKLTACGVKDPIRNLPWLRELMDKAKADKQEDMLTITLVEIGGEQVINYSLLHMSCIGCVAYHCDGSRLDWENYSQEELKEFQENIWGDKGKRIILWPEK
ncbi:hypothetical protein [Dyadobacter aurulentus]|uniref:hypothetical protein n=1 Tax=Dyadobacter sp. UC 10 TaxID=2605428 RepID=UPI0011F328C3|nr:hypothetical protein [Dyadobacter sp. UC 10]KAA0989062.1 hypothetical protein FXO21_02220 [Dyadobacter sp. UC 10]